MAMKQEEKNKNTVKLFYEEVMKKGSKEAAEELMLENYKQHNPQAEDGRSGLLEHVADLQNRYPNRKVAFIHLFADGDYVITHIHFILEPGKTECMGVDIFRFEGDKMAEHWDVIQEIPENSANKNGMM